MQHNDRREPSSDLSPDAIARPAIRAAQRTTTPRSSTANATATCWRIHVVPSRFGCVENKNDNAKCIRERPHGRVGQPTSRVGKQKLAHVLIRRLSLFVCSPACVGVLASHREPREMILIIIIIFPLDCVGSFASQTPS